MTFLRNITSKPIFAISLVVAGLYVTPIYAKESGTWTDPKTGLTWQRCSVGQTWNGYDCDGEPKTHTWDEQQAAKAAAKGWRMPAASELMSLVRCNTGFKGTEAVPDRKGGMKTVSSGCNEGASRPTIDTTVFPNTPDSLFWSSSPVANGSNGAWFVYFNDGDGSYGKDNYGYVRLVRSSQ